MKIVFFPHIALMKKSQEVRVFDSHLSEITSAMLNLMKESNGVGLAANQVALNQRIVVMQCDEKTEPYVFINPHILSKSQEEEVNTEGCLSFPFLQIEVRRSKEVQIEWQNLQGQKIVKDFSGLEAICIQHEIDHLNGVNFVDTLGNVKKIMALKKYQNLNKNKKT